MFKIQGKNIIMNKGDFGIKLPITITNVLETDILKINIYDISGSIIEKNLLLEENKYIFELTKEETNLLDQKDYMYEILQYRGEILQNTINKNSLFKVE